MFNKLIKRIKAKRKEKELLEVSILQTDIALHHQDMMKEWSRFEEDKSKALEPFGDMLINLEEYFNKQDKLQASIELARAVGVPEDKILHNHEEGEAFFMS